MVAGARTAARPRRAATERELAEALPADPRARAALLLAGDAGLRRAEIAGLAAGQIDLESGWIRHVAGKGGKHRNVPIRTLRLAVALAGLGPPLLGEVTTPSGLDGYLARLVPGHPGLHRLRHLAATRWANDPSIPLVQTRAWLGHSDVRTTMGYVADDYAPELSPVPFHTGALQHWIAGSGKTKVAVNSGVLRPLFGGAGRSRTDE